MYRRAYTLENIRIHDGPNTVLNRLYVPADRALPVLAEVLDLEGSATYRAISRRRAAEVLRLWHSLSPKRRPGS